MGLIKDTLKNAASSAKGAMNTLSGGVLGGIGGVLNQSMFQEYFTSGDMSGDVLMKRAETVRTNGSVNKNPDANIISNGSIVDVQVNQCMIIVENGAIVEACTEPGRYVYDTSIAPSFFAGNDKFGERVVSAAKEIWEQAKVGGQRHNTQRVYFINMGILDTPFHWGLGNVPFRHCSKISDNAPAIRINMMLKANGLAKLRIVNPVAFYSAKGAQMAGGDNNAYIRFSDYQDTLFAPAKATIREAIASSVSQISHQSEIAYTQILSPENAELFRRLANERIAASELAKCGFEFAEFSVNGGFMPREEDMTRLMDMEEKLGTSAFMASDLNMANYDIQKTMARGFENAGQNGGVTGIMGMGMAMGGGMGTLGNIQGQPRQMNSNPAMMGGVVAGGAANAWTCACGTMNTGKFCQNCGEKKVEPKTNNTGSWLCACGQENTGKFCQQCGFQRPMSEKRFKCDKCGWEAAKGDVMRFCPECGDPITASDFQ